MMASDDRTMGMPKGPEEPSGGSVPAMDGTIDLRTPRTAVGPPVAFTGNPQRSFQPEQVVASRFKIIRYIAKGGMGEVYEVEDLELKERLAIKTVLPEIALDLAALKRFTREIALSHKVTHPNACRIFDIFHHEQGGQDIVFLTMELLSGGSLGDYIREKGALSPEEALPIVFQMAGALGAAHQAGIVHRDFKPGNVMMVPSPNQPNGYRAVVTDFGLAQGSGPSQTQLSVTATGEGFFVGTPAYMAPEQVEGKAISPRADIYALGLVMYEMVTGKVAFGGTNMLTVATARLTGPPPAPEALVPNLDPHWSLAIRKCLERDPAKRWQSVEEMLESLQPRGGKTMVMAPSIMLQRIKQRRRMLPWAIGGALALVLAAGGGYWYWADQQLEELKVATTGFRRKPVAILGVKDVRGNQAWLGPAIAEMLSTELSADETIRVVPGDVVARTLKDLAISDISGLNTEQLKTLAKTFGAEFFISGQVLPLGEQVRVDLKLRAAHSGEAVVSASETVKESQVLDLVAKVSERLHTGIAGKGDRKANLKALKISLPKSPEATRLYVLGVDRLNQDDAKGAKALLEQAIAIEPKHALSHDRLGMTYGALGYEAKALEQSRLALSLARRLGAGDRIAIEARFFRLTGDKSKALALYKRLTSAFPDVLEYRLHTIRLTWGLGQPKEALKEIAEARKMPMPMSIDPRLDYEESEIYSIMGDPSNQQAAAARAAQNAQNLGLRSMVGKARIKEADAFGRMKQIKEARLALEEGLKILEEVGNLGALATAKGELAYLMAQQPGQEKESKKLFEEALGTFRELGDLKNIALIQNNMAGLEDAAGNVEGARALFNDALQTYRQMGAASETVQCLSNMAYIHLKTGQIKEALPVLEEALTLARSRKMPGPESLVLVNLGAVYRLMGRLQDAEKALAESMALAKDSKDLDMQQSILSEQAQLAMLRGDNKKARELYADYMKRLEAASALKPGQSDSIEGLLHFESGEWKDAVDALQKWLKATQVAKAREEEQDARMTLAKAYMAQGKLADAERMLAPVRLELQRSQSAEVKMGAQILFARLQATKATAPSLEQLRSVEQEARNRGYFSLSMDAMLAQADVTQAAQKTDESKAIRARAKQEAEKAGARSYLKRIG